MTEVEKRRGQIGSDSGPLFRFTRATVSPGKDGLVPEPTREGALRGGGPAPKQPPI